MYKVYCDGVAIYDLFSPDLMLLEPTLELELNSPGTFEFTIPLDHPYYDLPQEMLSRVWVIKDDEEIFRGRIIEVEIDWYKRKKVYCEGELAFLNDSIQRPAEYHNMTVRDYFKTLIEEHNSQVEEDKQFEIGYVLVEDTNDSLYRYTNYNSTLTEMKEDLVDDLGGCIRVRNQDGHRYLDYINIEDYGARNDQAIRFGINLLDYTQTMDLTDIATVIIPLGEQLEESPIEALNMRLTIESVNNGSDALESEEAVKTFGRITKTVVWDDVTQASNLLEKGKKYLSDYQWDDMVLEVTPVDLHDSDPDTESFNLGDQLRVISMPHGLDRYFPLSAMTIHLDSLDQNTFTLGTEIKGKTITGTIQTTVNHVSEVEKEITPTQIILNQAKEQATNLITAATHGYVVMQPNDAPEEILIMDTADTSTAKKLWRWNLNGLGYSSNGYNGAYGTAITMDGSIVADFITTGTLTANVIKTGKIQDEPGNNSWDMDNGTLTISSKQFTLDESGNAIFKGSLSAATGSFSGTITSSSGTIGGWTIGTTSLYNGTSSASSTKEGIYLGIDAIRNVGDEETIFTNIKAGKLEQSGGKYHSTGIHNPDGTVYNEDTYYYKTEMTGGEITLELGGTENNFYRCGHMELSPRECYFYDYKDYLWLTINNEYYIDGMAVTFDPNISIWDAYVWMDGSIIHGSDERLKTDIKELSNNKEEFEKVFDTLEPVIYKYKFEEKQHIGFTYQNVVKALEAGGIDPDNCAMVETEINPNDNETYGGIDYDDIVALLVYEVKKLKSQIDAI